MSELSNTDQVESAAPVRRRVIKAMPKVAEKGWPSQVASVLVHAMVILLLILPSIGPKLWELEELGAGGAGPAGGGGGGHRGTGGVRTTERLTYVKPQPVQPVITPPVIPPVVPPIEKKPEVVPPPVVQPPVEVAKVDSTPPTTTTTEIASKTAGTGGGSGNDGSDGNGPGRGGGKGSGDGTGTGSSTGPGTGGGFGTIYPPTVTQLVVLPMPAPSKDKRYELEAHFDVDSLGNATLISWNKPKDEGYAKKVYTTLMGYKFRPAVRADGNPTRGTAIIRVSLGK